MKCANQWPVPCQGTASAKSENGFCTLCDAHEVKGHDMPVDGCTFCVEIPEWLSDQIVAERESHG